MPRALPSNFASAYYVVTRDLLSRIGDSMAAEAGPPAAIESVPATDGMRVQAWDQRHPEATDEAMLRVAAQQYQAHRAKGLPDEDARRATAEDLTHFKYRARQPLYTLGTTSWDEQVKEATRLARLSARKAGEAAPPESADGQRTASGQPADSQWTAGGQPADSQRTDGGQAAAPTPPGASPMPPGAPPTVPEGPTYG